MLQREKIDELWQKQAAGNMPCGPVDVYMRKYQYEEACNELAEWVRKRHIAIIYDKLFEYQTNHPNGNLDAIMDAETVAQFEKEIEDIINAGK